MALVLVYLALELLLHWVLAVAHLHWYGLVQVAC